MVCLNSRWPQKEKMMKEPDSKILININFDNLDMWTFLGREGRGSEKNVQNRFVSLPLINRSQEGMHDLYPLSADTGYIIWLRGIL